MNFSPIMAAPDTPHPITSLAALIDSPLYPINSTLPALPSNETLAFCEAHGSPLTRRLLFAAPPQWQPYFCSSSLRDIEAWVGTLGTPTNDSPVRVDRQVERPSAIANVTHLGTTLAVCHLRATHPPQYACHYHKLDEHDEMYLLTHADGYTSYAICHVHDKPAVAASVSSAASEATFNANVTSCGLSGLATGRPSVNAMTAILCLTCVAGGVCLQASSTSLAPLDVARPAPLGMHCHPSKVGDLVYLDSDFPVGDGATRSM